MASFTKTTHHNAYESLMVRTAGPMSPDTRMLPSKPGILADPDPRVSKDPWIRKQQEQRREIRWYQEFHQQTLEQERRFAEAAARSVKLGREAAEAARADAFQYRRIARRELNQLYRNTGVGLRFGNIRIRRHQRMLPSGQRITVHEYYRMSQHR